MKNTKMEAEAKFLNFDIVNVSKCQELRLVRDRGATFGLGGRGVGGTVSDSILGGGGGAQDTFSY